MSRFCGPGGAELASGTVTRQMKGEVRDIFSASGLLGNTGSRRPPSPSHSSGVFIGKCICSHLVGNSFRFRIILQNIHEGWWAADLTKE